MADAKGRKDNEIPSLELCHNNSRIKSLTKTLQVQVNYVCPLFLPDLKFRVSQSIILKGGEV